ncbi:hypothetical protein GBAR_LOCUS25047 [Geodia barretti]|uniref:Uncharacterized protein n=1 Tax=Geodia barretti TaxID=519541 RepID=A0AA35X5R7_GEOBA|nr:hypothetical protein GBAR_LOCUS25047 [Geodia barretti]
MIVSTPQDSLVPQFWRSTVCGSATSQAPSRLSWTSSSLSTSVSSSWSASSSPSRPAKSGSHSERLQVRHGSHIHLQYSTGGDSAHHLHSEGLHQHLWLLYSRAGSSYSPLSSRPQFHSKGPEPLPRPDGRQDIQ